MLSIDCPPDVTAVNITPAAFVEKVRFDPTKEGFSNLTDGLMFNVGVHGGFEGFSLKSIRNFATNIPGDDEFLDLAGLAHSETAIIKRELIWAKLPKMNDYVDVDSLDYAEGVEKAFYEATRNQGW